MSLGEYQKEKWLLLEGNEGKLQILRRRGRASRRNGPYKDSLALLERIAKEAAIRGTDYSSRDNNEYIFGYGEIQLTSILVPTLWTIVDQQQGLVLVQCRTPRKVTKDEGEAKKWDIGWADYRVKIGGTIHMLEIKLVRSKGDLGNKTDIENTWNGALTQLGKISGKERIRKLEMKNSSTLFKTAIMFIPIFVKSKTEKDVEPKNTSYVEDVIYQSLEEMLSTWRNTEKPDWIASWLLPESLQYPWKEGEYHNQHPTVLILAKLCGKWEKINSNKWIRCCN